MAEEREDDCPDETDRTILEVLQRDARTPNAEIADQVGLSRSQVGRRLRRLEHHGFIEAYRARIDHEALGVGATTFTVVSLKDYAKVAEVQKRLCDIPEVLEVHVIVGDGDFLIKIKAGSIDALHELFRDEIAAIRGVADLQTRVVLHTAKETITLPVPDRGDGETSGSCV